MGQGPSGGRTFTLRAVVIGLLAVAAMAIGTQHAELWVHGTQVSQACPPINSFFIWVSADGLFPA